MDNKELIRLALEAREMAYVCLLYTSLNMAHILYMPATNGIFSPKRNFHRRNSMTAICSWKMA